MVLIDPMRTQQIIINLLSNAIKFSKINHSIDVNIEYEPINKDQVYVQLHVIDCGIGINPEDQLHLFKPYFQSSD